MVRAGIRPRAATAAVRPAVDGDVPALVTLAAQSDRAEGTARIWWHLAVVPALAASRSGAGAEDRFRRALHDPDNRVFVAEIDGDVIGMIWLSFGSLGAFGAERVLHIDQIEVRRSVRRRGVGRVLLQAASSVADENGVEAIAAWTSPQDRDANRYFARLGFAPLAVRRIAPVASLRRALATPTAEARFAGARTTVALRRSRRQRA